MASTRLTQGTKEYLIIDVTDKLQNLSSLELANPRFDVQGPAPGNVVYYTAEPATAQGMRVYCLIDTSEISSVASLWPLGEYRLWITFDTPAEIPRLGPFYFDVKND